MDMEYRKLGNSGLMVSAVSLGAWLTFGDRGVLSANEELMHVAYDAGVNYFDNAEGYDAGRAEDVMGEILQNSGWGRDTFIVSSKAFFGAGGKKPTQVGLSRKHLVEACHAAMKRLRVDYLDLYFCHRPDKKTPVSEVVWTMNDLMRQGKILYWGTSEWPAAKIAEACAFARENRLVGPTMEQPQYNILCRVRFEREYEKSSAKRASDRRSGVRWRRGFSPANTTKASPKAAGSRRNRGWLTGSTKPTGRLFAKGWRSLPDWPANSEPRSRRWRSRGA